MKIEEKVKKDLDRIKKLKNKVMVEKVNEKRMDIIYKAIFYNMDLDKKIEKVMKKYNYKWDSSGYGFGYRDIQFYKKQSSLRPIVNPLRVTPQRSRKTR